jgi:hypothetical protein
MLKKRSLKNRPRLKGVCGYALVDSLKAVDEFLDEGFAGFCPEEAAADVAVFFDGEGEGEEHLDVLLDVFGGVFVELVVGEGFGEPGGVEAEVDADVAILFEAGVVEGGAEAEDADGGGLELPEGVEGGGVFVGIGGGGVSGFGGPEAPAHLELVGHVVVELLGGFGDGGLDDGAGGVLIFFGAVVVDVDALVGGGFVEADGIDGGGGDALALRIAAGADDSELTHDRDEGVGEGLEAEVGEPETEVELIGHRGSLVFFVLAGRAHCAWGGHFVTGIPCPGRRCAWVLPLVGGR